MKKLLAPAVAILLSIVVSGCVQEAESVEQQQEKKSSTEYFVVQSKADEGYLNAVSLSEYTEAPHGFILDDKYEIGDIVQVTFNNDDLLSEEKITGEQLELIVEHDGELIKAINEGLKPEDRKKFKFVTVLENKEFTLTKLVPLRNENGICYDSNPDGKCEGRA